MAVFSLCGGGTWNRSGLEKTSSGVTSGSGQICHQAPVKAQPGKHLKKQFSAWRGNDNQSLSCSPGREGVKGIFWPLLINYSLPLFYREVEECNVIRAFGSQVFLGLNSGANCPKFSKFLNKKTRIVSQCEIVLLFPERRGITLNHKDCLTEINFQIVLFMFKTYYFGFFLGSIKLILF